MKLEIMVDSTLFGSSSCIRNFILTGIGNPLQPQEGAYREVMNCAAVYGIAVHKYIDTMFKTSGYIPEARARMLEVFNMPKGSPSKDKDWLADQSHVIATCYATWEDYIQADGTFEILSIPQDCYWCNGGGKIHKAGVLKDPSDEPFDREIQCSKCNGTGKVIGPATEITFKIKYYEDDFIIVYLCGTIDSVGKFKGGCYAIRDFKTSSSHLFNISSFEMSRQLRIYTLACKIMSRDYPDSILGKVGATNMGAFIDAIKLHSKAQDNEYERSAVMQLSGELDPFEVMLRNYIRKLSLHIQNKYFPKEGILNGTCTTPFGRCKFWNVCKSPDKIADVLLARDFKRVIYNPLNFGNGE